MTDVGIKPKTGLTLLTLGAGQFLMTLDSSVMNVSIATVAEDVGTSITGIQTAIAIGCVIYGVGSFTTALAHRAAWTVLLHPDTHGAAMIDASEGGTISLHRGGS